MRSQARDAVFKYLFSTLFNQGDEGLFSVLIKDLKDEEKEFANKLLDGANCGMDTFVQEINQLSHNYNAERIFNTDKCAIIVGMAELNAFPETPIAVVIDEAVKLAAVYSAEKGTDFVNGILAEYVKEQIKWQT